MTRVLVLALLVGCTTTHTAAKSVAVTSSPQATTLAELLGLEPPKPVGPCPENGLLHLQDTITEESAEKLAAEIKACKGRAIAIAFDSGGGGIFAAQTMQKAIEGHDRPVLCVVDGMAASAAFVTLQACTSRYATSRSILMAHEGALGSKGGTQELENGAEFLRVLNWGMAAYCAHRMGMTVEAFQFHVTGGREWYFTQPEAFRAHAIDGPAENVAEIVALARTM